MQRKRGKNSGLKIRRLTSAARIAAAAAGLALIHCSSQPLPAQENNLTWLFHRVIDRWFANSDARETSAQMAEAEAEEKDRKDPRQEDVDEGLKQQWKQLEIHFSQQLRPILIGQINLARQACEPTKEQSEKIAKRGKAALQSGVNAILESQKKMQLGRWDPSKDKQPDPQKIITQEFLKIAREELPRDKLAALEEAIKRREASRKRAAMLCLVAKMDQDLYLSRDQRDQLLQVLDKHWNADWQTNLQFYLQNQGGHYPNLPDKPILDVLEARQKAVWKQVQKADLANWGWGSFLGHFFNNAEAGDIDAKEEPNANQPDQEDTRTEKPDDAKPGENAGADLEDEVFFVMGDGREIRLDDANAFGNLPVAHNAMLDQPFMMQAFHHIEVVDDGLFEVQGDDQIEAQVDAQFVFLAQNSATANAVGESEEESDEEQKDELTLQQRAERQAQAAFEIGVENFDIWIYQAPGGRDKAAKRIDDQLQLFIDSYQRLFALTDEQAKKLELCGRGDVIRFQQQVEVVRARFMEVRKDQERFNSIWNDIGPLQQRMQTTFFDDQSLMAKSIGGILNPDQRRKHAQWEDDRRRFQHLAKIELVVAELETYSPMTVAQRAKIVQLINEAGPPPRKPGHFDQIVVMYLMSKVPDAQWLAVLDKRQFDAFNTIRQQGRQYGQMLRQNRILDE